MASNHSQCLEYLTHHLDDIDIDRHEVIYVLSEPEWYKAKTHSQQSLCDLIVGYSDRTASAIELKGSPTRQKQDCARKQIYAGRDFIFQHLKAQFRNGIFVVYHGLYTFEHQVVL